MDIEPLLGKDCPMAVTAMSLETLIEYLAGMGEDGQVEEHLREKVRRNWQKYEIPDGDAITALGRMQDGFIVGLRSGKVMLVMPPAHCLLELHHDPIIGVFAASNYFLAIATVHSCKLWNAQKEAEEPAIPDVDGIASMCGSMSKELLFLGLENGAIQQYVIRDKEKCALELKFQLKKEGENSPVYDIKTTDGTGWVAARYQSNAVGIWDHANGVLLNLFTFTAGPGLPTKWKSGEQTHLPKFFAPAKPWAVFPECILLTPRLLLKFTGNRVTRIYPWSRMAETDDKLWETYGESLGKGHISYLCDETLITFTKPGARKKKPSEKRFDEIELDLGVNFSLVERSDADNYIAFVCEKSLEVMCISAIETDFTHQLAGPVKFTKRHNYIFTRFHSLMDRTGEPFFKMSATERVVTVSRDGMWITTGNFQQMKMISFTVRSMHSGDVIMLEEPWNKGVVVRSRFAKHSEYIGILLNIGLLVIDLRSRQVVFSMEKAFEKEKCRLKLSAEGVFVAISEKDSVITVDPKDSSSVKETKWDFSRFCFLNQKAGNEIIAYSMTNTQLCSLGAYTGTVTLNEGFECLKVVNSSKHCVGYSTSGIFILSTSSLSKLLRISVDCQVIASKTIPRLYTFTTNSESDSFTMIDVWDLDLGLRTSQVYSGLKHVLGNKLRIRGPGMWQQAKMKLLTRVDTCRAPIKNTWVIDFESLAALPAASRDTRAVHVAEEQFERQCIALKKLAIMLKIGEFSEVLSRVSIKPANVTVLHLLAYTGKSPPLAQATASGSRILKSAFGSPLAICLERKSRRCLNVLLSHLIVLRDESPSAFISALLHISEDMPNLIQFGSPYLIEFFQQVIVPLPEEVLAPAIIKPKFDLPYLSLTQQLWVEPPEAPTSDAMEKEAVEYLICPFAVHTSLGTAESVKRMRFLVEDVDGMELFSTFFIKTIVNMKWEWLWPYIVASTVLYWCLLATLIAKMFHDFHFLSPMLIEGVFIAINSWFALVEILQAGFNFCDYFRNYWNFIDVARIALSYVWILTCLPDEACPPDQACMPHEQQWLTFLVVLLSVFRGITTFQAFDATRYYVRMIIVVTLETASFIWVFFYSTFAFGLLFAAVHPDLFPDFFSLWQIPYNMNMGSFDSDGKGEWYWLVYMAAALLNIVIMLNLVVSVLGDAFGNYQGQAEAADIYGKAEVIYEHELMMWWRRGKSEHQYIQICRQDAGEAGQDSEKVVAIKKMLKQVQRSMASKKTSNKKDKGDKYEKLLQKITEVSDQLSNKIETLAAEVRK